MLAELIDGTGSALCASEIDAWGVDALDAAGFAGLKDNLFLRLSQLTSGCLLGAALIGGYVAGVDISWPWLLSSAGFAATGLAAAFAMRSEARLHARVKPLHRGRFVDRTGSGLREGFAKGPFLMISLSAAIVSLAWNHLLIEWPVFLRDHFSIRIWLLGWIFGGITLAQVAGAEITARP